MSNAGDKMTRQQQKPKKRESLYVVFEDEDLCRRFKAECKLRGHGSYKHVTERLAAAFVSGKINLDE